jgi:hypothetical protein
VAPFFSAEDPRIYHVYFETKISTTTVHRDPTTNKHFRCWRTFVLREIVARAVIDFEKKNAVLDALRKEE